MCIIDQVFYSRCFKFFMNGVSRFVHVLFFILSEGKKRRMAGQNLRGDHQRGFLFSKRRLLYDSSVICAAHRSFLRAAHAHSGAARRTPPEALCAIAQNL